MFPQTWHATSLHTSDNGRVFAARLHASDNSAMFTQTWHATSLHLSGNGRVLIYQLRRMSVRTAWDISPLDYGD
ncbi:MAG: hypothetical protein HDS84_01725 [Bacteroidales bacterium]|nr:hypothetical protein [Bacteroidales bacterium]MBD5301635.1 hypothetical protein [Bacteroides sp.]